MKPMSKHFDDKEFLHANRRAARLEYIEFYGKPTAFRSAKHATMKQYNRQRDRRAAFAYCDE